MNQNGLVKTWIAVAAILCVFCWAMVWAVTAKHATPIDRVVADYTSSGHLTKVEIYTGTKTTPIQSAKELVGDEINGWTRVGTDLGQGEIKGGYDLLIQDDSVIPDGNDNSIQANVAVVYKNPQFVGKLDKPVAILYGTFLMNCSMVKFKNFYVQMEAPDNFIVYSKVLTQPDWTAVTDEGSKIVYTALCH